MVFVRTILLIAALLLGYAAIRSQPSAHVMPPPQAQAR